MDNLVDALIAVSAPRTVGCAVKKILEQMDNAEEVDALLCDPMRSAAAMCRVLKERGFDISVGSLTRHRRGECKCKK